MPAYDRRIVLAAFIVSMPSVCDACSCAGLTLEERFAASANVFTARVTGGELTGDRHADDPEAISTFEVGEVFKGSIPFKQLRTDAGGSSCGISFAVGYEYLFFAPDDGHIGACSGTTLAAPQAKQPFNPSIEYARILHDWKAGRTPDLSEPWTFMDADGWCGLSAVFPTDAEGGTSLLSIGFHYRAADAPDDAAAGDESRQGYLELAIDDFDPRRGTDHPPLVVRAGEIEYEAGWVQRSDRGRYVLKGPAVIELTKALARVDRVEISGAIPGREAFEGVARTTHIGTGATDMLQCMTTRDGRD